jgi:cytochrome c oxidase subunit 3
MKKTHIGNIFIIGFSPWPFFVASAVFSLAINLVGWFHSYSLSFSLILFSVIGIIIFSALWLRDLVREATFLGYHTKVIQRALYLGMLLFILSEVMFFVTFFWTFFILCQILLLKLDKLGHL